MRSFGLTAFKGFLLVLWGIFLKEKLDLPSGADKKMSYKEVMALLVDIYKG